MSFFVILLWRFWLSMTTLTPLTIRVLLKLLSCMIPLHPFTSFDILQLILMDFTFCFVSLGHQMDKVSYSPHGMAIAPLSSLMKFFRHHILNNMFSSSNRLLIRIMYHLSHLVQLRILPRCQLSDFLLHRDLSPSPLVALLLLILPVAHLPM